jgi:glucosamine-6-phosphate deaminase
LKFVVLPNAAAIGLAVGDVICDLVRKKSDTVLGLATGASPLPTYQRMIDRCKTGEVSFKDVRTFNLDEYCDLPETHPCSYHYFMRKELFDQVGILPEHTHFLDGNTVDEGAESQRYSALIEQNGGIDLQLLGIGRNGHIGFNEPSENFTQESFKVALTDSTIAANSRYFRDIPMPKCAMTMGIGLILRARKIILIATGSEKATAIKAMLEGSVTPRCPASALQKHPEVAVFLDPAAAALLNEN